MRTKISIKKILIAATWLAVGAGFVTLLVAANDKNKVHVCKDVVINIKGIGENLFIDKGDIVTLLKNGSNEKLIGSPLNKLNLAAMERRLEKSSWINQAELYVDGQDVMHVTVYERQPIARVFTKAGTTFYIDSAGKRLPILQKLSVRVPVITNFPSAKILNAKDSALLNDVKSLAMFITNDEFWNAQVGQVDIAEANTFELIPTIGNHIIKIGTAENLEQKFNKLYVFYKQVLSKTGFDKYSVVDVQYQGQVIGRYKGATSVLDSLQLRKNIEEMMALSQAEQLAQMPMPIDSTAKEATVGLPGSPDTTNKQTAGKKLLPQPAPAPKPNLKKANPTPKKPAAMKPAAKKEAFKIPKAVMGKRQN